ncbi:hypothetical protein GCM10008924_11330 [Gracilibacillus halotolerans]
MRLTKKQTSLIQSEIRAGYQQKVEGQTFESVTKPFGVHLHSTQRNTSRTKHA